MTSANKLRGVAPPVLTPLVTPDELDAPALGRILERLIAGGVAGAFVLGTTGEAPALSYRLRYELVARAAEFVQGRVPLLVGVSDTSLTEAVRLAQHAAHCGATAIVATPPYYFPLRPRDVVRFFLRLADASPLPLYVYNMPACTGVGLTVDDVAACAPHQNIIGVKDSSGDLELFRQLLTLRDARADWSFFVGPEHLLMDAVLAGGDGGVHGGANLDPALFVRWFHAADRCDLVEAEALRRRVLQLGRIYEVGGDFLSVTRGLKCALSLLGVCSDVMAEPAEPYVGEQRALIGRFVRELFDAAPPRPAPTAAQ